MVVTRRKIIIILSVLMVFCTFVYVEHPVVRSVKTVLSSVGLIDSDRVVVGITDIRSVDHIRGDRESDIALIEYSDFNCVICAAMQDNFNRIVREENVLLVSRHSYLDMGSEGFSKAVIAECVAKHAGEEAYFGFMNFLYENQYTDFKDLKAAELEAIRSGVEAQKLQSCIANDTGIRDRIWRDGEEARLLGSRGTPYVVIVHKDRLVGVSYANEYQRFLKHVQDTVRDARG